MLRGPAAEHAGCRAVGAQGKFFLVLGAIDRGMRSGVDDELRRDARAQAGERVGVVQVDAFTAGPARQAAAARRGDDLTERRETALQFEPDLAVGAEQENFQKAPVSL